MKSKQLIDETEHSIVCYCGNVSKGTILKAIDKGNISFEQLRAATGVCPEKNDCVNMNPLGRCCKPEVMALMKHAAPLNFVPNASHCGRCKS